MLYLMFNSWWFFDGSGHLFCWLVWTKRPTNCCVEIGSLSVCYVLHYVNVIDSIWKKSAFESVFESDDRNPTLFMLKICFESFPRFSPWIRPWNEIIDVHLLLILSLEFFNVFIYAFCSFFHTVLESSSMCSSMYWGNDRSV